MDTEWRDRLPDLYQQRDLEVLRKLQGLVYTARMESGSILHLEYIWRVVSQLISDFTHTLHISTNIKVYYGQ